MKNCSSRVWLFAAAVLFFIPEGCRNADQTDYRVEQKFADDPPIPSHVTVEQAGSDNKEGNLIVKATISKEALAADYLAYEADGQKVVLKDNGKSPDEKAGDRIFTGFIHLSAAELQNSIDARLSDVRKSSGSIAVFEGRHLTGKKQMKPDLLTKRTGASSLLQQRLDLTDLFTNLSLPPVTLMDHSLMINSLNVVEDSARTFNPCTGRGTPNGKWTFGFLMSQLVNTAETGINVSDFTLSWLRSWTANRIVNEDTLAARAGINSIIDKWLLQSARAGAQKGKLDMNFAPFKLLAIVNRIDLMSNPGYGGGDAGEGRFVFELLDQDNCTPAGRGFLVIFEYGVNKTTCGSIKAYAQEWYNLKDLTIGSSAYNQALEHITDQFSLAGTNRRKPNRSSLNQLRTDEIVFSPNWELREFNLDESTHLLKPVTVKLEPAFHTNNTAPFAGFVNTNSQTIISNGKKAMGFDIPDTFPGTTIPFAGGKSTNMPTAWDGVNPPPGADHIISDTARHFISLNTCSGCHNPETGTSFTHVHPAPFGTVAGLSDFLTGQNMPKTDPRRTALSWSFADLLRRSIALQSVTETPCVLLPLFFRPMRMPH